jgi:hypothetical protein
MIDGSFGRHTSSPTSPVGTGKPLSSMTSISQSSCALPHESARRSGQCV